MQLAAQRAVHIARVLHRLKLVNQAIGGHEELSKEEHKLKKGTKRDQPQAAVRQAVLIAHHQPLKVQPDENLRSRREIHRIAVTISSTPLHQHPPASVEVPGVVGAVEVDEEGADHCLADDAPHDGSREANSTTTAAAALVDVHAGLVSIKENLHGEDGRYWNVQDHVEEEVATVEDNALEDELVEEAGVLAQQTDQLRLFLLLCPLF
ncbi:hypothetical protein TYRP_011477 [Tyrophagus putrescentiae]|nr:hypothetical protein TYRP_011477 [Tyrophagus putrescentiae]